MKVKKFRVETTLPRKALRAPALVSIVLAVLMSLVGVARAGEGMPVTLGNLELVLQLRVDQLAAIAAPSKPEKKEAKALGQALEIVSAYNDLQATGTHDEDKVDLKGLTQVAKLLKKSKTPDIAVLDQSVAIGELVGLCVQQDCGEIE